MKKGKILLTIALCFSLIQLIINNSNVEAQPSVPGFEVQLYTNVSRPQNLSFEPSGVLYAGNGFDWVKIYKIDVGGSPVLEYGDTLLIDPDAVAFDSVGTISGRPGSVLVGGIDGPSSPTGYLAAILPDESTITIFGPGSGLVNPSEMLFDSEGRLLIADAFAAKVFFSDDGLTLNTLIGNVYLVGDLALDENGNIYLTGNEYREIRIYSPDGTLLNDSFVTGLDIRGMDFGPSSPPWDGHLFAVSFQGKLYRIDEMGTVTEIGTGFNEFPWTPDLEFGPDGAMYVSDPGNNMIYRIVPALEEVAIDIKPGSYPNSINLKSKGKITVAILTTDDFDSCDVDPDTVSFAGANPLRWNMEDVDHDGDYDMLFHFMTQELDLTKDSTEATLEGETIYGDQITGTDSVNIVPKGKGNGKKNQNNKKKK